MPRPVGSVKTPTYRHHKPSSRAVVTIDGKDFYLGPWKSKASLIEYDRLIGEWLANGRRLHPKEQQTLAVSQLINAYRKHAEAYYGDSKGKGEFGSIRLMLRIVKRLYVHTDANDFGPRALKAVRQEMIAASWSRKYINCQIGRLSRMFKWAVAEQMVAPAVHQALIAVEGLRKGKTTARESKRVLPVPDARVQETLQHVSSQVKAIIQLQQFRGMRPGEVCIMRGCDIDTTGKLWTYKPSAHKTENRGHDRTIYLGPRAQDVIRPFFKTDVKAFLFSPADAEAHRHAEQSKARKTNVQPSQVKRALRSERRARRRAPGDRYDVASYRRCIARACEEAFGMPEEYRLAQDDRPAKDDSPEQAAEKAARRAKKSDLRSEWHKQNGWHPHQLRHSAATSLRKQFGLEAAQVILGHKTLTVTELYAEKNVKAAQRIMGEVG